MGAYMIFDIEFNTIKDKRKFEKKYKPKPLLGDSGFAWKYLREGHFNPIYYMGFMGYADPSLILKECLTGRELITNADGTYTTQKWSKPNKSKIINIKFLAWIPINDKNSKWEKIRG